MKNKIIERSEKIANRTYEFLSELVKIRSYTGEEGKIIRHIKKEMEFIGYDEIKVDGMGNLFGRLGSGSKVVAIEGHCDTVGVGNKANWENDPLSGFSDDEYIYGRGTVDQKGSIAAFIQSAKIIKDIGVPDDLTIWHVVSVQEELYEGINWQFIIDQKVIEPDVVILTEPSNLDVCIGQRGRMDVKVRTIGKACHGANPHLGVNSIYLMADILKDIEALNDKLPESDLLGKGTVTVTDITSNSPSFNAVPETTEIHLDRRLTTDDTEESVLGEIRKLDSVKKSGSQVYVPTYKVASYSGLKFSIDGYYSAWLTQREHPLVQKAEGAFEDFFGVEPKVRVWNFSTNGVATKGIYDIPTIGFGPGDDLLAHTVEERILKTDILKAMQFYAYLSLVY